MLSSVQQIKVSYEVNNMTPEEISSDQELDIVAVKASLMSSSSKYRKDCGLEKEEDDDLNFNNSQLRDFNKVIYETAMCAETADGQIDYRTRLAAAIYGRDDKKGRKEVRNLMQGNTFNILNFNEQIQRARAMKEAIVRKAIET